MEGFIDNMGKVLGRDFFKKWIILWIKNQFFHLSILIMLCDFLWVFLQLRLFLSIKVRSLLILSRSLNLEAKCCSRPFVVEWFFFLELPLSLSFLLLLIFLGLMSNFKVCLLICNCYFWMSLISRIAYLTYLIYYFCMFDYLIYLTKRSDMELFFY